MESLMPLALADLEHEGVVGHGAFAIVKRYRVRSGGDRVAVKTLSCDDADAKRRFLREIELLRTLPPHRHIVELLGTEDDPRFPSYIMPLAESNLERFIERNNSGLTEQARGDLFHQICEAVAHAHEHGVLHRDLAPRNVLVFPPLEAPSLRVADFGLGRNISSDSSRGGSIGHEVGHVAYVAPEQRLDLSAATTRSDVYSLGRLLRFLLTGRDPDALGACSYPHVVATATMHHPSRRYADAASLLTAFEEIRAVSQGDSGGLDIAALTPSSPDVVWHVLHDAIVNSTLLGHVYYVFLAPITSYLEVGQRLEIYHANAGPAFTAFVERYVERMEQCMTLTGWPFRAMDWFGRFLFRTFDVASSVECRRTALIGMWMLAYEQDQWAVQSMIKRLFGRGPLAPELDESVAARILASHSRASLEDFSDTPLPPRIRVALARRAER